MRVDDLIDLTEFGEDKDARYLGIAVAGLQYYEYNRLDDLIGRVMPRRGDRLQLDPDPKNHRHENAIKVEWRDGQFHLGHLPYEVAEELAPVIADGHLIRAYVTNPGDGTPWSVEAVLVSEHLPRCHNERDAAHYVWQTLRRGDVDKHDRMGRIRGDAWIEADKTHRAQRRKAMAKTLAPIILAEIKEEMEAEKLPPKPPEKARGVTFKYWDDVPAGLRTRTAWLGAGFLVKKKVRKPFANIEYYARGWKDYDLYSVDQVVRKPLPTAGRFAAHLV